MEPAEDSQDDLYCARDNTLVRGDSLHCPHPSSYCEFRESCPVRDAERLERRSRDLGDAC